MRTTPFFLVVLAKLLLAICCPLSAQTFFVGGGLGWGGAADESVGRPAGATGGEPDLVYPHICQCIETGRIPVLAPDAENRVDSL